ncbi:hypothetical protein BKA70DRAFT_1451911 [Coprinopsis sp. MPI-PUGE-AT-0042]|nr:hypothetical protein BKA70DRAFT_1451911 [Coprinopsis sp. MPI-PUGE-AT-0042]
MVPPLLNLTAPEWQSLMDYLSARLRACAHHYATVTHFQEQEKKEKFLAQLHDDITTSILLYSAGLLTCSSTITRPPCLQQLYILAASNRLDDASLLLQAASPQHPVPDIMSPNLILNSWWTTGGVQSFDSQQLFEIWKSQLNHPGLPSRRNPPAIQAVFDGASRRSLQEVFVLTKEALAVTEVEITAARDSIAACDHSIARLETECISERR